MLYKVPLFLSTIIVSLVACSHQYRSTNNHLSQNNAIQLVTTLEDEWMTALVKKDTITLSKILDTDFTLSGSSKEKETRSQYLSTSAMAERTLQPIVLKDRSFKVYHQTVVSTGMTTYTGKWKEAQFNLPVRYTNIYSHTNGQWKVVGAHISIID